jgi:hypothetical protein
MAAMVFSKLEIEESIRSHRKLLSSGVFVCFVEEVKLGVGHHASAIFVNPILAANFPRIIVWPWIQALMNMMAQSLIKISLGLFLLRLVQ